jgi:hypothetical protein
VEQLLASHDAEIVLLPYLHPYERLALVVEAFAEGLLTESHFELLADPVAWFRQRGTSRVIQVLPSGPDSPVPDGPHVPDGPPPLREAAKNDRILLNGSRSPTDAERRDFSGLGRAGETEVLPPGRALGVCVGSTQTVAWMLVPFTHPEPERLTEFVTKACRVLKLRRPDLRAPAAFFGRLRKALKDKKLRAELAETYRALGSDRNLSSMSLYSGPAWDVSRQQVHFEAQRGDRWLMPRAHWHPRHGEIQRLGWLSTGDSVLSRSVRAAAFGRFFARLFPHVATFVLPHHGSKHNFTGGLFQRELKDVLWVAAHGRNVYGHPDRALLHALERRGLPVRVQMRRNTELQEFAFIDA